MPGRPVNHSQPSPKHPVPDSAYSTRSAAAPDIQPSIFRHHHRVREPGSVVSRDNGAVLQSRYCHSHPGPLPCKVPRPAEKAEFPARRQSVQQRASLGPKKNTCGLRSRKIAFPAQATQISPACGFRPVEELRRIRPALIGFLATPTLTIKQFEQTLPQSPQGMFL